MSLLDLMPSNQGGRPRVSSASWYPVILFPRGLVSPSCGLCTDLQFLADGGCTLLRSGNSEPLRNSLVLHGLEGTRFGAALSRSLTRPIVCGSAADQRASVHYSVAYASAAFSLLDRPGFGHSARPRGTTWTPEALAKLIHRALEKIGISRARVLGHSWGASVAVALALKHPETVTGLILASGYYYPTPRVDVLLLSGPAVPVAGDILSHTVSPILGWLLWPLMMCKIFGPAKVPAKFQSFPKEMALRPTQIRASSAETALMIPGALAMRGQYKSLKMPVIIIAGEQDRLIDIEAQSARLHREVTQGKLRRITNAGHMVHQTATALVMRAIDEAGKPSDKEAQSITRAVA